MQNSLNQLILMLICSLAVTIQAQTPSLLKDINAQAASSSPRNMTTIGNTIFFSADDGVHGRELWKTDGSTTTFVKDIHSNGNSNPSNFCNLNGIAFFTATNVENGTELWKSDGTAAGTVMLIDIVIGQSSSTPEFLTTCNGKVFFSAKIADGTRRLYFSDGNITGQVPLANSFTAPANLTAVDNQLFFSATTSLSGTELWKTNGTSTSTVANIMTGNASSFPRNLINVNGTLFFSAINATHGRQIWKSNPVTGVTERVSSLSTAFVLGIEVREVANVSGTLFFSAPIGVADLGNQIFKVNTAANGTIAINGEVNAERLTAFGTSLFFTQIFQFGGAEISRVPANSFESVPVATFSTIPGGESPIPQLLKATSAMLFFTAATSVMGRELWKVNVNGAATPVQDFVAGPTGAGISDMCVRGSDLFFASNGTNGNELRRTTGATISTVTDIGQAGSFPREFIQMGDITFFTADNGQNGRELWKTSGNTTVMVKDLNAGVTGSDPSNLTVVTNGNISTLFFVAAPNGIRQICISDGTSAGTKAVQTVVIGGVGQNPTNLTAFQGKLFYTATNIFLAPNGNLEEKRLYKSDGTPLGTAQVTNSPLDPGNLAVAGSNLFFAATDPNGRELWRTTVNGTPVMVKNIRSGNTGSNPANLLGIGNRLFFTADDGINGREVWKSDGVVNGPGTNRISDFGPNTFGFDEFTNFNGTLFFTANPGVSTAPYIYKVNSALNGVVDGTTNGGLSQGNLCAAGTNLYFTQIVQVPVTELQLCKITTASANTFVIKSFPLTLEVTAPLQLTAAGNNLFFTASDATNGRELWKSNGTTADLVSDIRTGFATSNILEIKLCGTKLFFSANNLTNGQEPWSLTGASNFSGDDTEEREVTQEITAVNIPDIKIYPNPVTEYLFVDMPDNNGPTGMLSLFDAAGKTISEVQAEPGDSAVQMDVRNLPKGVYIVRWAQRGQKAITKKVVVQ